MVYANLILSEDRNGSFNLGDDLQLIAIENMYSLMGIKSDEIVRISLKSISEYNGEYAILPISLPLYGYQGDGIDIVNFSPKIIPVFLGLSLMTSNLSDNDIAYFKRFEPIGCRDFRTLNTMRKYGIFAYLNGCMTLTLPKAENLTGKIPYLVDIPERYMQYIPECLKTNAIRKSQIIHGECENAEKMMMNYLKEYCSNASVIITTRMHCAFPCIAMGLPVIVMKENYSFRFSIMEKYIHPYTIDEFLEIDWNPQPVEYEDIKEMIMQGAINRVKETQKKYADICSISQFYESDIGNNAEYVEHIDYLIDNCKEFFDTHPNVRYGIWGITQVADMVIDYLKEHYPSSKLTVVHDKLKKTVFRGVSSTGDAERLVDKTDFVFVTAYSAIPEAISLFDKKGFKHYIVSTDGIENI